MRNNTKNNTARRITAILLTLVMITGSFGVAAFAEDAGADEVKAAAAAEKSVKEEKSAEAEKPAKDEEPAEAEKPAKDEEPAEAEEPAKDAEPAEQEQPAADAETVEEQSEPAQPSGNEDEPQPQTPASAEQAEPQTDNAEEDKAASDEVSEQSEPETKAPASQEDEETTASDNETAGTEADTDDETELTAAGKTTARNAELQVVHLPPGVTASFTDNDGNPASWTGSNNDYGYMIPVGSKVQLSVKTDAAEYSFSAVSAGEQISLQNNSFVMPAERVDIGIDYYYHISADLTSSRIPDGTSITINGTKVSSGEKDSVKVKAGTAVSLSVKTSAEEFDLVVKETKADKRVSVVNNSFTMPKSDVTLSGKFYQLLTVDLMASDVPDGFYVTFEGIKIKKGQKKNVKVEANQKLKMEDVADLGKGYNYGNDKPSGDTQLKMMLTPDSGSKEIIPLDTIKNDGYKITSSNVKASLYVLHSFNFTFTGSLKSCSADNISDSDSPWYGHEGDTIRLKFNRDSCDGPIAVVVKDADGNLVSKASVDSDSWSFKMPSSVAYITVNGELAKKKYAITVRDSKNGSLKVDSTQQAEGKTVTIEAKPDQGYAVSGTGIIISYTLKDKAYIIKADVTEKGSNTFTFKMPAANVTVSGAFIVPYTVNVMTNNGGTVTVDYNNDYGDYTSKGKVVKLKVTPKEGYILKSWVARDADGKEVVIRDDGSFIMPASNVGVGVVFGKKSTGGSGYVSNGSESYYTGWIAEDDGAEVDEEADPEELIDLLPLLSMITTKAILGLSIGVNLILAD